MKEQILQKVDILYSMYQEGKLGGEIMPEDENPKLKKVLWKIIYISHYQWL